MPSASPRALPRLAVAACCGLLLLGAAGCSTTQEKAAEHRAEAERILEAREKRQRQKQKGKSNDRSQKDGGNPR